MVSTTTRITDDSISVSCENEAVVRLKPLDWFEESLIHVVTTLAIFGVVAVIAAAGGFYHPAIAWLLVVVLSLISIRRLATLRSVSRDRLEWLALAALSLVLIGALGIGLAATSQTLFVGRDPAVYANTGRWISATGSLVVDAEVNDVLAAPGVRFETLGSYAEGEVGRLEYQFGHFTGALLAIAYDISGHRGLFRASAVAIVLGLGAICGVARRLTDRTAIAIGAVGVLALTQPYVVAARSTLSEPFTLLFFWAAILALIRAWEGQDQRLAAASGFLLGATVIVRADSVVLVVAVVAAALGLLLLAENEKRETSSKVVMAFTLSVVPSTLVGVYDLDVLAGRYSKDLPSALGWGRLAAAILVLVVLGVSGRGRIPDNVRPRLQAVLHPTASVLAVATPMVLLMAWLVRPRYFQVLRDKSHPYVAGVQGREGVVVNGQRLYAEDSLLWVSWYVGLPLLVLAIVGSSLLIRRLRDRHLSLPVLIMVSLLFSHVAYYLWRPSIFPDQPWAGRRFVVVVLPVFVLLAALTASAVAARVEHIRTPKASWFSGLLLTGLLLVGVVPVLRTLLPVWRLQEQTQSVAVITDVCRQLPADAAVLVPAAHAQGAMALRAWCQVPTGSAGAEMTRADLSVLAADVRAAGLQLYAVSSDEAILHEQFPVSGQVITSIEGRNPYRLLETIESLPSRFRQERYQLYVAKVASDGPLNPPD